jgi:type 2 lantibiotic biosynthesis protein LanM
MEFSRDELVDIVERASTISDRLGSDFSPNNGPEFDNIARCRLEKWCQLATKGNQEDFKKRLSWDKLTLETAARVVVPVSLRNTQNLPSWVETLNEYMKISAKVGEVIFNTNSANKNHFLDINSPLPFQELFIPLIFIARQKLATRAGSNYDLISQTAHGMLERNLLASLSNICLNTIELKFSDFRINRYSTLAYLLRQYQNNSSQQQYQVFIQEMLQEAGLLSFFKEYPVLARIVANVTDFWVDAISEFLSRLASDWSAIQQTFQPEVDLGQVIAIQSSLSEPHNNRRCVIALFFASGLKLIYKPRDLGLEEAFFKLLCWFNQQDDVYLPFKLLKVLNFSSHGWVEFVEYLSCQNQEEVRRYYQRTGMLLCLLHLLKASDCHHENLIACGEYPVLVDMETLMHPQLKEIEDENLNKYGKAQYLAYQLLYENSVLATDLLPQWLFGSDRQVVFDVSGLGAGNEQQTSYLVPKVNNINTDNMSLKYEAGKILPTTNLPLLDGLSQSPQKYIDELVDGFQQMYQFLVKKREALLGDNSPLTQLTRQKIRFVFRPTRVYICLLQNALQPRYLRDGVEYSIQLEALSRTLFSSEARSSLCWPLLQSELQALEKMDIPYFSTFSDSDTLPIGLNKEVKQFFREPSYLGVINRLQKLNQQDLANQISIIRTSLCLRFYNKADKISLSENIDKKVLNPDYIICLTQEQMLQQAIAIAQELKVRAIRADDGSVTWIGLGYLRESQKFQLQPVGYGLYDGNCGIALFLAALARVTGDLEYQDLALEALQPFHKVLRNLDLQERKKFVQQIGIGGAIGLGSIIYSLVHISQFLNEPLVIEDAKQVACLLTYENIADDRNLDVMSGTAGAILGLLLLYKTTKDPAVLQQAQICGYHLLKCRKTSDCGYQAWPTLNGKLLTGFSHGAAGIAYALLRLYQAVKDRTLLEAVEEAITYERSLFSPETENWPDLRIQTTSFMTSWCHGAPGICLARLGSLSLLDTQQVRQEIEIALKTTQKADWHRVDHLCCGNFGIVEVLQVAAQQLSRPDLLQTAYKRAAWVVARAQQAGCFRLFPYVHKDIYNPSFFTGTAGIGYQLLRLGYPDLLPSVLLWQ